ncbi:proteasome subunit alpha type-7-like [Protopterus annectens]|uniref:proteasome subunit alpha type-7-like n=1 Tax=Protopterus annectens TaxID=7888 RepID=UPI001CFBD56A|nr:proteasome subunit alpha type-7-like [Protopterus annectens]
MAARYDRAITVFSPDGHLFQVEYAQEAVKKGSTAVGIRGKDTVVLGVEKKSVAKLQEERTVRKICALDDHVCMAFAGVEGVISHTTFNSQDIMIDSNESNHMTNIVTQQELRTLLENIGRYFHTYLNLKIYMIKANAIGRSAKTVREFLEKNYSEDAVATTNDSVKLAIKALLEVVQSGGKNIELAIIGRTQPLKILDSKEIESLVAEIEKEKEEETERKKQKKAT